MWICADEERLLRKWRELMMRAVIGVGFLLATALVYGQASSGWPCAGELAKSEGDSRTLRVTIGVAETYVEKKILPDVSDLKRKKTNSTVVNKVTNWQGWRSAMQ